jgi:long-chain acyl-CoA synthetase
MKDWPNLAAMFFNQAERLGDTNFLWAKQDGAFRPITWRQAAARAAALAAALKERGVAPGDRVMLLSENRPEWLIADLGIMAAGAITVPSYVTNGTSDHEYVLTHSGAKGAIVSNAALETKLSAARGFRISMERDWEAATSSRAATPACDAARTDTACLIYTSGTGGRPKGVMLSHGALLSNCVGANTALQSLGLGHEIFLSFLPLSHAYEHTAGQFFPIMIGAEIYYTDAESLAADLKLARPTIMTSVPRLYETMHGRITRGIKRQGGLRAELFAKAVTLGLKKYEGEKLSLGERVMDAICDFTVRKKVRDGFGGRMKAMVSGGAPLNPDIGKFFTALGLTILQGYGQTESAPIVSVNVPETNRVDTVGPPMEGVEVKIADDGEILVRGELVMRGYWDDPEATAAAIRDGWLHTGDVGEIDDKGRLRITDRKKDIIVNSGGDNLAPQKIEGMLTLEPEIAQAMVYGDKRPHIVALIVPNPESDRDAVAEAIERVNARLSVIERVRRFALAPEEFTIANGMMTPTLKVRRAQVIARYRDVLEAMYRG